ncbi:Macrolide export protein MacA [Myxococcus stipitatus]
MLSLAAHTGRAQEPGRPPTAELSRTAQAAGTSPRLVGVVSATRSLDVLPQIEGRLEQLKVRLGDRVEAGQVLAQLDARTHQLELTARQARLKAAEAEHSRFVILLEQARQLLVREQRIREHSAAEALEKAEHGVALASADVDLAKARLVEAQAQVSLALESLEYTRIRAPFTGVVSEEYLQPGMMTGASIPIVRLVGEERLLRFAIPESLVSSVRGGQAVQVRIDGAAPLQGVVERLSPELDATSRHLKAEARLTIPPELRGRLPIGAIVPVELGSSSAHASGKRP